MGKKKKKEVLEEMLEEEQSENEKVEEKEESLSELEVLNDKFLRLNAEFINYKRRTEKEKSDIYKYANEKLILDLLTFMDNIERAVESIKISEDKSSLLDGVSMIKKNFDDFLQKQGVEIIESKGEEFDPNRHHAVLSEEVEGTEEGIVLDELQKGYTLREKVIRPAMVKVSK